MSSNKSPGADSVLDEIYKHGGENLTNHLHQLFTKIWNEESVPHDFKDATVVHIYKRKGDRSSCDNHRGISLLSGAGKILSRLVANRLSEHVLSNDVLPESQCGFRPGRGTADMIFAARQLQEKCREHHLLVVFPALLLDQGF